MNTRLNYSTSFKVIRKLLPLVLFSFLLLAVGCKKDKVDATTTKTLQSSINDMTSSLSTLQQVKFNEALYILKTFGVDAEGDTSELNAMGKLINGLKVPGIFTLADQVAQKNGIDWSSSGPPSLGEMNIFADQKVTEFDPNDIEANSLNIQINSAENSEVLGPQSLQIIPRLVDNRGKNMDFSGAGLEVIMEVYSGGNRILTAKNLMQNNDFKGFKLRFASLSAQKIIEEKIDITVSVKTTKKTFKMSKIGVAINPKALLMPAGNPDDNPANSSIESTEGFPDSIPTSTDPNNPGATQADPKVTVSKFLNSLSSQNLRGAYETAENPSWESFEKFSNPTSGFGGVKSINVKNLSTSNTSANSASVNATYDIVDKSGKSTAIQVTFGLKNVNGDWKISSYKIN